MNLLLLLLLLLLRLVLSVVCLRTAVCITGAWREEADVASFMQNVQVHTLVIVIDERGHNNIKDSRIANNKTYTASYIKEKILKYIGNATISIQIVKEHMYSKFLNNTNIMMQRYFYKYFVCSRVLKAMPFHFDVVIQRRPDLLVFSKIPIHKTRDNKIYVYDTELPRDAMMITDFTYACMNDWFAIYRYDSFVKMASIWTHICSSTCISSHEMAAIQNEGGEFILGLFRAKMNVKAISCSFPIEMSRKDCHNTTCKRLGDVTGYQCKSNTSNSSNVCFNSDSQVLTEILFKTLSRLPHPSDECYDTRLHDPSNVCSQ